MIQKISYMAAGAALAGWVSAMSVAWAGDQAKTIINGLDPKSMNGLFDALPRQPDAALTNIIPVSPNKFRFLFIWPGSNPLMTYDRVGRSFADRFTAFAAQLKPLATGYCLPSKNMFFGTASYGEKEVNVAYRDIEVHYQFGWQPACGGQYIKAAELELLSSMPAHHGGYGAALPVPHPTVPAQEPRSPMEGLKPFINSPAAAPPLE
jgi:hypothetical protein